MEYVLSVFVFVCFGVIACGFGARLLSACGFRFNSDAEKYSFSFALGFAAVAYIVLALGIFGLLYRSLFLVAIALLALVSIPEYKNLFFATVRCIRKNRSHKVLLAALALIIMLLLVCLAPSYSNDSMVYHLTDAKYFATHHYVGFIPYNSTNSLWPYLVEMFFTLALLWNMPAALGLVQFSLFLASCLAVYALCKRFFTLKIAWLSMLIFMLVPGIWMETSQTYVDMGMVFYCLSAFYAFLVWKDGASRNWLILSAIMAGLALSVKYFSLMILLVLVFFYIQAFLSGRVRSGKEFVNLGLSFALAIFISSCVWYVRQYMALGNPVFPFFSNVFGTSGLDSEALAALSEKTIRVSFGMGAGFLNGLTVAWRLTMHPRQFGGEQLGPLFLAVVPGIFFLRPLDPVVKRIGWIAAAYFIIWFFVYQNLRFLLPIAPFLSIVAAYVVVKCREKESRSGRIIVLLTGILLLLQFLLIIRHSFEPLKTVLGFESRASYLASHERSYEISEYINRTLKARANVLVVNEGNTFFLDTPHKRELYYWLYSRYDKKCADAAKVTGFFKAEGFSHILYAGEPDKSNEPGTQTRLTGLMRDEGFKKSFLKEVYTLTPHSENANGITYFLYEINR